MSREEKAVARWKGSVQLLKFVGTLLVLGFGIWSFGVLGWMGLALLYLLTGWPAI